MSRHGRQLKHIQKVAERRRARNQAAVAALALPTEDELLQSSSEEDVQEYIVIENDAVLEPTLQNAIKWKEGAGNQFRTAYTGDSRATKQISSSGSGQ